MPKMKSRTNPASSKERDAMTCVRSYARQEFRAVAADNDEGKDNGLRSIAGHPADRPPILAGGLRKSLSAAHLMTAICQMSCSLPIIAI